MDFGNAPKVSPPGGVNVTPRADIVATQGSVGVELPPEKTVQSAQAGEAVRLDIRAQTRDRRSEAQTERRIEAERQSRQDAAAATERRIVIEPQTRAIVLQTTDPETGETISQLPDETLLKLRIYSRELTERARITNDAPEPAVERSA